MGEQGGAKDGNVDGKWRRALLAIYQTDTRYLSDTSIHDQLLEE